MKPALKTFLLLAIGGMLLSLLSLFIWIRVNKDFSGLAFGHVVSMQNGSIALADRHQGLTTVLIGTGTRIMDQRETVAAETIPVGQFLQVSGKRVDQHTIRADVIRLMRSPRTPPPREARP